MAKLTDVQKVFIVGRLACFYTPTEVVEAVKQELGVEVSRQQVAFYDPTTAEGQRLSKELKDLFKTTRERFNKELQDIPVANQAYRLRVLQDLIYRSKAPKTIAQLLEQAAKEMGGAFTSRRELTGKDGGPIAVGVQPDLSKLSDGDLEKLHELLSLAAPDAGGDPEGEG